MKAVARGMLSESVAQESGAGQGRVQGRRSRLSCHLSLVQAPAGDGASVGVSCVSTEQRGRGPEPETLPL